MKTNTKSSITLLPAELQLVGVLRRKLGAKSNVEVVRRGLQLLREQTDRDELRRGYHAASAAAKAGAQAELQELDALTGDGLDDL